MDSQSRTHNGRRIEVAVGEGTPRLLIDGEEIEYGQLPSGRYFLKDYAYDQDVNLMELAARWVDYQERARTIQRGADSNRG